MVSGFCVTGCAATHYNGQSISPFTNYFLLSSPDIPPPPFVVWETRVADDDEDEDTDERALGGGVRCLACPSWLHPFPRLCSQHSHLSCVYRHWQPAAVNTTAPTGGREGRGRRGKEREGGSFNLGSISQNTFICYCSAPFPPPPLHFPLSLSPCLFLAPPSSPPLIKV